MWLCSLFALTLSCVMLPSLQRESKSNEKFDSSLIPKLRDDANLDLSADEEYEDLRAELLAYHTALASLTSNLKPGRRMYHTPCWQRGGICISKALCQGSYTIYEVAGCRDKMQVCCFRWNKFLVREDPEKGLYAGVMPWSQHGRHVEDPPPIGDLKPTGLTSSGEDKKLAEDEDDEEGVPKKKMKDVEKVHKLNQKNNLTETIIVIRRKTQ